MIVAFLVTILLSGNKNNLFPVCIIVRLPPALVAMWSCSLIYGGLRSRMQDVAELDVPLIVEMGVGANWDEAH